ncbi:MAG: 50S ribosomal protein L24 [Gemmatimonadetes bacterium]|nr:50S ribosomal protein L24 [Gemmatimonadota bacterium]
MKPLVFKKSRVRTQERPRPLKRHVAKGDRVRVITGDHKGQEGAVLKVLPRKGRVVVEGVNLVKRHRRATAQAEGGIIEFPAPIHLSNVMLLDPKSGEPTRVRRKVDRDGTLERLAVKSGQPIPRNR